MPTQSSDFEREMLMLEGELKRLEAEYNMFFAGRLPRLPWESRARVEALIKKYDRIQSKNTAERFRFGSLQARFMSFCELWERALKARELGRPQRGQPRKEEPAEGAQAQAQEQQQEQQDSGSDAKSPAAAAASGVRNRIVHVAKFKDPSHEVEQLQELYERLTAARKEVGEPQIPYHKFAEVVRVQFEKFRGGENEVAFRVAFKDGKTTLTVKALKS